jgi:hypothetical protein
LTLRFQSQSKLNIENTSNITIPSFLAKKQGVAPGDVAGSWRGQPAKQKLHEHNALAIRTKSSELLTSGGVNRGVKRKARA